MAHVLRSLVALPIYGAAVVWLTWPLGAALGTHLPNTGFSCPFDPLLLAWALAHESRTAISQPTLLMQGNSFHPDPDAVLYGEAGFGALPYFMPVFLSTDNPTLALNLTLLGSVILTAWTLHLVTVRWTRSFAAGAIAAGAFLLTRWVLWSHVPCVPTYALLQYLPLIVFLSVAPSQSALDTALLAILLLLQGLSNAYLAVAVLVPLSLLTLVQLARPATRKAATLSLAAITIASTGLLIIYGGYLRLRNANPDLLTQTWWGMRMEDKLPFGPFSYMTPLGIPLVFPLIAILGTIASLLRHEPAARPRRVWVVLWFWVIVGVLLSFSPVAWWGNTKLTLPHLALPLWLGVYNVIRIPDRLGVGALVALCLLAGLAFADLSARLARSGNGRRLRVARVTGAVLLLGLAYAEYGRGASSGPLASIRAQGFRVQFPGAIAPFNPPPQYLYVRPLPPAYPLQPAVSSRDPLLAALSTTAGPLLEVPVGAGPGGTPALQARAQYRSIFHKRPLINGYSGYYPSRFPARMALARALPDPKAIAQLRRETSLASILVHLQELPPPERQRWLAAQQGRTDLGLARREGDTLLFTVIDAPP